MISDLPAVPDFTLAVNDCDDGRTVLSEKKTVVGYVYPDVCGGWKPVSVYGRSLRNGRPASSTPERAASHLFSEFGA